MHPDENNDLPTVAEAEAAVLEKMSPDDREGLSAAVRGNLREILQAMIESAKGLWVEKTVINKYGVETALPVYREKPNMDVAQYLVNQLMGKPRETQVDFQLKQNIIVQNEIKISKMSEPIDAA